MYLKCEKENDTNYIVSVKVPCEDDEQLETISNKAFELLSYHEVEVSGDYKYAAYIQFTIKAETEEEYTSTLDLFLKTMKLVGFDLID